MQEDRIFEKACLIQLSISCWQAAKKLDRSVMEQLGSCEWLKGRKVLINPEILNPVRAVAAQARLFLQKTALPFPIKGLTLVPKEMLTNVDAGLGDFQQQFWNEVRTFEREYAPARSEAEMNLGHLFNEMDYPLNIREKFSFNWRFVTLDIPGKNRILSPQIYERERDKFVSMMQETREMALAALREEFAQIIHHAVERLSNTDGERPKTFRSTMIENFHEFFSTFEDRNMFNDAKLSELVAEAKSILKGVTPEVLRNHESLRTSVAASMSKLKESIDGAVEELPRRKLRLAA